MPAKNKFELVTHDKWKSCYISALCPRGNWLALLNKVGGTTKWYQMKFGENRETAINPRNSKNPKIYLFICLLVIIRYINPEGIFFFFLKKQEESN